MRVTQTMLNSNFLRNLSNSYDRMGQYQDQLSTGKKFTKPSDDPVSAMKGINFRSELNEVEQYQRNLGKARSLMENSDSSLDKATLVLQRVRELAVQASNDTYETKQRSNVAEEVKELRAHLIDVSNTKVNGKYIFNGTDTETPRFTNDGELVNPPGNEDDINIPVSKGIQLKANVTPDNVFNEEVFAELKELEDTLRDPNSSNQDIEVFISKLDLRIDNVVGERAQLGARMNRLDMVEDRLTAQEVVAARVLSDNEDAEIEKVIMNLKSQESVHRAALSTGARVIQPTLMDFLR
ncbi:flagellar hook-associated protein FlgL [Salirhabdus salicampi]|uniref:flagellar hook-associated protein FlgL n=1 Tax=Salirhabdus salicampi TaxID=476102 RepID=UPI0020C2813F|nr:flagellar hook-associated protein FlgL [Salirhabdus salicampi]MCP8617598.1 flagellar hook-associated protein FlgL [Salirhabdus salicampi]